MFAQLEKPGLLKQFMKLATYQTLYQNLMARYCCHSQELGYDFFTSFHEEGSAYLQHYYETPTMYHCKGGVGFQGMYSAGNSYFVIAGRDYVLLLLEPEAAMARNLPFISILEGNYFKPHLGCHLKLWREQIEQYDHGDNTSQLGALSLM